MRDSDVLSPSEATALLGDMMKMLTEKYGQKEAMRRFNEAATRAGSQVRVLEAKPDKPS
jgi:hypothetical protein